MAAPTPRQWLNCFITGTLLLGVGNGLVCYAEQTVASGLAAVAVACVGLFIALFAGLYGHWPRRVEWVGLAIGLIGVVILNLGGELRGSPIGAIALIVATHRLGVRLGVEQTSEHAATDDERCRADVLRRAVARRHRARFAANTSPRCPRRTPSVAMIYLIVFGSLLGFSAYIYLLANTRPALAASYAYVNPPVAVLIGVLIAGESVTSARHRRRWSSSWSASPRSRSRRK